MPNPLPASPNILQAVDQFNALVAQVQKSTSMIEKTLFHISRARLVTPFADAPSTSEAAAVAAGGAASGSNVAEGPQLGQATTADADASASEPGAGAEGTGQVEGGAGEATGAMAAGKAGATGGDAGAAGAAASAGAGSVDVPDLQELYEDWEQHRQQVGEGRLAGGC